MPHTQKTGEFEHTASRLLHRSFETKKFSARVFITKKLLIFYFYMFSYTCDCGHTIEMSLTEICLFFELATKSKMFQKTKTVRINPAFTRKIKQYLPDEEVAQFIQLILARKYQLSK